MKFLIKGIFFLILLSFSVLSQDKNSIILFGKELVFETTLDEFKILFDEFKPETNDFFYGTNGEGFELYSIRKENIQDPFKGHLIVAKFKDNKLSCMEFHGSSDEITIIVKDILPQLVIYDKKITNDELEIETEYYKKDNLKAELVEFESTLLTICLYK